MKTTSKRRAYILVNKYLVNIYLFNYFYFIYVCTHGNTVSYASIHQLMYDTYLYIYACTYVGMYRNKK